MNRNAANNTDSRNQLDISRYIDTTLNKVAYEIFAISKDYTMNSTTTKQKIRSPGNDPLQSMDVKMEV